MRPLPPPPAPSAPPPPLPTAPPPRPTPDAPARVAALAAASLALLAASPAPASAFEETFHGWRNGSRPRRHKREMGGGRFALFPADERRLYGGRAATGDGKRTRVVVVEDDGDVGLIDRAADEAAALASAASGRVARALSRARAALVRRAPGEADGVLYSVSGSDPVPGVALPRGRPVATGPASPETVATIGWAAAALLAAGLAAAALASARAAWRRSRAPGRWVRDRSLGGKMVWVEDVGPSAPSRLDAGADLLPPPEETPSLRRTAKAAPSPASSSSVPAWWSPPASSRSPAAAAAEAAAAPILARLQEAKLAGRDYDVPSLVALRRTLGATGGRVTPRALNVRDAIYRAAAAAAVDAATSSARLDGGVTPAALVCGLAADLGVPDADASNIVLASVAAKARGLLVDAAAAARAAGGDPGAALLPLAALAALLAGLPLDAGAPQVPLVAAALASRASLDERRALFLEYGRSVDPGTAGVVAAMLGFDYALVSAEL